MSTAVSKLPQAMAIYRRAESGDKIDINERRHVIAYLMAMDPEKASDTSALSILFKVSEQMIRKDKRSIREEKAASIKEDDVGLVIADIRIQYENQVRDMEKSKGKCKPGTALYLQHCKEIMNIEFKTVEALQNLGYLPKNLGTQTTKKFEFRAIVDTKDGSVRVENEDYKVIDQVEVVDEFEAGRRALDEEFADRPMLMAAPLADNNVENKTVSSGTAEPNTQEQASDGSSQSAPSGTTPETAGTDQLV